MFLPTSKIDFDSLADSATSQFFNNPGSKLQDQVVKIATEKQLNPEEIKRLVEKTNISTTKKVLASVKDRRAEFELVDSQAILTETHKSTSEEVPMEKSASLQEDFSSLYNAKGTSSADSDALNSIKAKFSKTASESSYNKPNENLQDFFRQKAERSDLQLKKMATELQVKNDLDYLISEFSKYYPPDFNKFANEAYSLHGDTILPVLYSMRAYLEPRTKNLAMSFEKVAYVIDDREMLLKKLAAIKDSLLNLVSLNKKLASLNPKLVVS